MAHRALYTTTYSFWHPQTVVQTMQPLERDHSGTEPHRTEK